MNEFAIVDTSNKWTFYEELSEFKKLGYQLVSFAPVFTPTGQVRYFALLELDDDGEWRMKNQKAIQQILQQTDEKEQR